MGQGGGGKRPSSAAVRSLWELTAEWSHPVSPGPADLREMSSAHLLHTRLDPEEPGFGL